MRTAHSLTVSSHSIRLRGSAQPPLPPVSDWGGLPNPPECRPPRMQKPSPHGTRLLTSWEKGLSCVIVQTPNHTDPKSPVQFEGGVNRRHQIGLQTPNCLDDLVGGGRNRTDTHRTTDPKSPVQFTPPPNRQVWFGVCMIWGLYDLPHPSAQIVIFGQNFKHQTSCFASQRSFRRKTNDRRLWKHYLPANTLAGGN